MKAIGFLLKLITAVVLVLIIVGVVAVATTKGGKSLEGGIYQKVSDDSVDQYNMAVRAGDKIEICVRAGLVSAAFSQAKNEPEYLKWKAVEKKDCRRAGMPR